MTGRQLGLIAEIRELDEQLFDLAARRRALAVELRESAAYAAMTAIHRPCQGSQAPPPAAPIAEETPA